MNNNGLIGHTGLIGSILTKELLPAQLYNRSNINQIENRIFDRLYISAPTGNRLYANKHADDDFANVQYLFQQLTKIKSTNQIVLIGTVDSLLRPELPYGKNRLWLEQQIKKHFANVLILRLGALIHPTIQKNVLYDLRYKKYLESINSNAMIQWYDLNNLTYDIEQAINCKISEKNLISEPIAHREIIQQFFPDINIESAEIINYTVAPYCYTKKQIFSSIRKYLYE